MIHLSLYEIAGVGVIVKLPTGIIYSNQTGGTACLQPEVEGAFVPTNSQHFEIDPESLSSRIESLVNDCPIDDEMANKIDQLLEDFSETSNLCVDRSLLRESHEAWIHIVINPTDSVYTPIKNHKEKLFGVLTWLNSD